MKRFKSHLLDKRFHLSRLELDMLVVFVLTLGVTLGSFFTMSELIIPNLFAATSPWTQTDWSGGVASGVVTSTVTTYASETDMDPTTSGQFSIEGTSGWAATYASWGKRKGITVTNSGSVQTNYQVRLAVTFDGDMQADFDDLRFTNSSGAALDYWLQSKVDSTSAVVWVEVDSLAGSGDTTIYMYYGNAGASSDSSGDNTFILFDNFDDGTINTSKWTEVDQAGGNEIVETGGRLTFTRLADDTWDKVVYSNSTFARSNISFEFDYEWVANNSSYDALMFGWHDSGTGVSYTDFPHAYYNPGTGAPTSVSMAVYEDGSNRGGITGTWVLNQDYDARIRMRASGGSYYDYSIDSGLNWNNSYTSSYSTESNLRAGWTFYSGTHAFDNARIRQWLTTEPTSVFAAEDSKYASSGILISNTLNAEFASDWGTLSYTTSGTGTTTVKVRTDSNSNMSGATDWSSCSGISSGTDLTATDCVTDTDQYLQYQVTLNPSGASTPVFESISIAFSASDQVDPDVNASGLAITALGDTNAWTSTKPVITWTSGEDDGDNDSSGLAGYCIALDEVTVTGIETSTALNPETNAGSLLNALNDGITNNSTCPYIVGPGNITSINLSSISGLTLTTGKHYYFSIKAVDLAGNVYSGASNAYQDLVDFKYDATPPINVSYISAPSNVFGNVDDMSFNWPTSGAGISSDPNSGVIGWQYSLDSGSSWRGPDTQSTLGITYIEDDGSTSSHTLSDAVDGSDISEGINTIYLRTVDEAGNFSSSASYRTAPLNYGGEAPNFAVACDLTTGVTVTPSTSTSNLFALLWDSANATGGNSVAGYYYMINTSAPSTLSTLESNSTQYIHSATTSVSASKLTGSVKGTNYVYVVAYDDADNYSQSNCLKGIYTLNSTLPDPVTSLSASDASIKSDELWRASLTWNEPSYKGTGTLTYVVQRSTDNSSWSTITTTTGTSYTDTVTTSQTYYYRVGVKDTTSESIAAPTYSTSVSVLPKGTWDSAPTLSSGPTVTDITTKKATISWSTSRVSDSKVSYGTGSGSYFDEEPSNSTQLTSHEINLTNLSPGTTYYYKAKWTDEDGNTGTSTEKTFTTDAAPVVTDPKAVNIGLESTTISYTVSGASSIKIYYGPTTNFGGVTEISTSTEETTYTTQLVGLSDDTKYFYKINAFDTEDNEYEGNVLTFQTLPAPKISSVRVQQVKGAAQPTAYVSWITNTEVSSIVTYYPVGSPSSARDEVNVALTDKEHTMIIRGLLPNTPYTLIIKGRDVLGNEAQSDPQTITTATDTRPPSISSLKVEGTVETLSANDNSIAQLVVSWDTDEPSTSQVEFGEGTGTTYSQKTQEDLNLTFNHIVVISGLTPSKVYHLRALSSDEAGNIGNSIDTVTITPKATKSALDLVINNLSEVFGFLGGLR